MRCIFPLTGFLCLALAPQAMAQIYAATPASCGVAPEGGYIEVGPKTLIVGETSYTRISKKRALSDGWSEAEFQAYAEGERLDDLTLRYQITPQRVRVIINETEHAAVRCP